MRVCPGVNQLRGYAHTVPGALHAAFEHMRNAEFLGDLAQVATYGILVLHHACTTNYFQVGDLGEIGENFILHAVCEVSVLFLIAKILKGKNGDTFCGNRNCHTACRLGSARYDLRWRCSLEEHQQANTQGDCQYE